MEDPLEFVSVGGPLIGFSPCKEQKEMITGPVELQLLLTKLSINY